jgi:hypothetical protein
LSLVFVGFVLAERVFFFLIIYEINKVTEHNFVSHMCIDDLSLILLFPLHIFPVNYSQCKLFSDNR